MGEGRHILEHVSNTNSLKMRLCVIGETADMVKRFRYTVFLLLDPDP
jgi:hypothetical protein